MPVDFSRFGWLILPVPTCAPDQLAILKRRLIFSPLARPCFPRGVDAARNWHAARFRKRELRGRNEGSVAHAPQDSQRGTRMSKHDFTLTPADPGETHLETDAHRAGVNREPRARAAQDSRPGVGD